MQKIPSDLIEFADWSQEGFKPVMNIDDFQVAILNYFDGVSTQKISRIERHILTDEIFILVSGEAYMVVFEENNIRKSPVVFKLEKNKINKVRKAVWHQVMLSEDASILIFEKSNTSKENSEYIFPDKDLENKIMTIFKEFQ